MSAGLLVLTETFGVAVVEVRVVLGLALGLRPVILVADAKVQREAVPRLQLSFT